MASAAELERKLRAQPDCFELKANEAGKSDVWKHFSLIFEKDCDDLREMKYLCACNSCRRVYAYKSNEGVSFGTKNLLDHIRQCTADKSPKVQVTLPQCVLSCSVSSEYHMLPVVPLLFISSHQLIF